MTENRKTAEMVFHNARETVRRGVEQEKFFTQYPNQKWYLTVRESITRTEHWLKSNCPGKVALDYCCGIGESSLKLAQAGAFVHAIDISDECVRTCEAKLRSAGFGERHCAQVMDAEQLSFPWETFDLIYVSGVLHHLDLPRAYAELARVLKPTGKVLCIEAFGHNPLINLYRRLTPNLRTAWEAKHILKQKDLRAANEHFREISVEYYHLLAPLAIVVRKTRFFEPVLRVLERIDRVVLRIPGMRRMAWQVIFELRGPRRTS